METKMLVDNKELKLKKNTSVTIIKENTDENKKWFQVHFSTGGKEYDGFVRNTALVMKNKESIAAIILGEATWKTVRAKASEKKPLTIGGTKVKVASGTKVELLGEVSVGTVKWYRISFSYKGKKVTGYIKPKFVSITERERVVKIYGLSEAEFEEEMTKQGIPELYKQYLRSLHEQYPFWQFRVFNTGLKWDEAVKQESKTGRSLISNSKSEAWKSKEPDAYDKETGTWKVFDGSTWVAASKEAVAYYMDPRNFLNERTIYQFELQAYQPEYQTAQEVDQILSNTPFAGKSFTYTDPVLGRSAKMTYTSAFIAAGAASKVSPLHLATRTKQEVVTSATTTSIAVTGTNKTYPGIYNFYNIGAFSGANPALNGLKWASEGDTYMRPWTDPYRSIVGGAVYIGSGYINRGQDTVYLEKFNVTETDRYTHQYMTNVEAAYSEAIKIQKAYTECDLLTKTPLVFRIPYYEDMPAEVCQAPK
ncbi:MAG: hypothetical protein IKQ97_07495 [Eubacterium sp.]|nr:hypothetical protein [Eubacterium sp.]